jgi:hypothetical protein
LGPTPPLFSLIDEPVGWKFVEISWVAQVTWRNFLLSFAGNFALLTFLIPWLGKLSSRSSCWYSSCNCVLFALVWGDMSEISLEIFPWFIEISRVSCYFRSASDAGITPTVSSALQRKKGEQELWASTRFGRTISSLFPRDFPRAVDPFLWPASP